MQFDMLRQAGINDLGGHHITATRSSTATLPACR
jgi:hypothetical protein